MILVIIDLVLDSSQMEEFSSIRLKNKIIINDLFEF